MLSNFVTEILLWCLGNKGWWGWNEKRGPFAEELLKRIRTLFFFMWLKFARRAKGKAPQKNRVFVLRERTELLQELQGNFTPWQSLQ
jgi:hypothetical protein